ncbi:MAG TPA: Nramp family divalent metal transporter [Bryobacteraceae bacterium]|nr:Nramp family divalent metal transporter [Bryobacteraceae bacterium]
MTVEKPAKADLKSTARTPVRDFFGQLGPGLITGAADDDPSGIATFSVAGAAFGYGPLWTALFSFPLMSAVQSMCARLGMVTGMGLAAAVRRRYSRWVLWGACLLLVTANVINIGADLGGIAEASHMVTGIGSYWWPLLYAGLIVLLLFQTSYRTMARVLKWLTLALLAYVVTAFIAEPDWKVILRSTFVPDIQWSGNYLAVLVGILGTSISPYLFFWQAAEEVEEERAEGRRTVAQRRGASDEELRRSRNDVITGMFFSNVVMYFIILTTAATLHVHGQTHVATARQAAEALRPLAGNGAYWLFTFGLIGTGMLGIPVLAGSCAYAIAEAMAWSGSLEHKPRLAPKFYAVLAAAVSLGLALDYLHVDAVKMLFWAAVANGVLAPPLIVLVVLLTSDPKVMGDRVNPLSLRILGWLTVVIMAGAAAGMFFAF